MSRVALAPDPVDDLPAFVVPDALSATEPPEARALERDEVRLLVAAPGGVHHALFRDIGCFLRAGDLLVVNTSATVAAATDGIRPDGARVVVHFSMPRDDGSWIVELRLPDGSGPVRDAARGERVRLAAHGSLTLLRAHPADGNRLWSARVDVDDGTAEDLLARWGRPVTYGYLRGRWPLATYQTVFAREPGSAEMASAGRPFTERLVARLVSSGVLFAPVLLHAGVSSLEAGETPPPERFHVPETTARLVNHVRASGGRVVAVGTTPTRALESVARPDGTVVAGGGWTELVLGPDRAARVVDGLVTGWHSPGTSHLGLLQAVAGPGLVADAYGAALEARYLWHEFGDSCLFLPDPTPRRKVAEMTNESTPFTEAELRYLATQRLGRLATIGPAGVPQNNPVGFRYNPDTATIDIGGLDMGASRKFRNVEGDGRVAFVVDDIASIAPWHVRGVEIRGRAEAVREAEPGNSAFSREIIRIHPTRILAWGLDSERPGMNARDVDAADPTAA